MKTKIITKNLECIEEINTIVNQLYIIEEQLDFECLTIWNVISLLNQKEFDFNICSWEEKCDCFTCEVN